MNALFVWFAGLDTLLVLSHFLYGTEREVRLDYGIQCSSISLSQSSLRRNNKFIRENADQSPFYFY